MTRRRSIYACLILIVMLAASAPAPSPAVAFHEPTIVASEAQQPQTDGEYVVWLSGFNYSSALPGSTIWAKRLPDGEPFLVAGNSEAKGWPDVDDGIVVWLENRYREDCPYCDAVIRGKDLRTGREFEVADHSTLYYSRAPSISGEWVVWLDSAVTSDYGGFDSRVLARNIRTMDAPIVVGDVGEEICYYHWPPQIERERVVWMECYIPEVLDPRAYPNYRIWTKRIGDTESTLLVDEPGNPQGFDLGGDYVVYFSVASDTIGIVLINLRTNERRLLTDAGDVPVTDGRYVFWEQPVFENGVYVDDRRDIGGYDIAAQAFFSLIADERINMRPDTNGGALTWEQGEWNYYHEDHPLEVHVASIADVLPSAWRADASADDAGLRYFAEVGHHLGYGFRAFWEANGELGVFGFPLTEEFSERDLDTGLLHTVQYLERQRFEWHPENAGTPYAVLLGRLGAQLLASQGRDWRLFPAADSTAPHYFPETQHAIAEEFYEYWGGHGLDFGDTAISLRESLALFGYPLSEPMLETNADGDTVLTQYFERAVFEYHPDNPEPYRVLLRRLGAEVLAARGW